MTKMKTKHILALLIIIITIASSQKIIFSTKSLKIFATKNISSISTNIKFSNQIHQKINELKLKKKPLITQQKDICDLTNTQSIEKSKKEFYMLFGSYIRDKRGFAFLGNAFSWLTDTPSASEWKHEQILIKNLLKFGKKEHAELDLLKITLESEGELLEASQKNLVTALREVDATTQELQLVENVLDDHILIDNLCNSGSNIAKALEREITELKEIKDKSLKNWPSKNMFPMKKVQKAVMDYMITDKTHTAVFAANFELHELYSMECAITAFLVPTDTIHSVMTIPLADFTDQPITMKIPYLELIAANRLQNLEKIARKNIDTILCYQNKRSLGFYTRSDLDRCQTIRKGTLYICTGRIVQIHNIFQNKCSLPEKFDPKTIIIQTADNEFLIDSIVKSADLICNDDNDLINFSHEIITFKSMPTKIEIPQNCYLHCNEFTITKLNSDSKSIKTEFKMTHFNLTSEAHLRHNLTLHNLTDLTDKFNGLHDKFKLLDDADLATNDSLNTLNEDFSTHDHKIPMITGSLGLSLGTISIIIVLVVVVISSCRK